MRNARHGGVAPNVWGTTKTRFPRCARDSKGLWRVDTFAHFAIEGMSLSFASRFLLSVRNAHHNAPLAHASTENATCRAPVGCAVGAEKKLPAWATTETRAFTGCAVANGLSREHRSSYTNETTQHPREPQRW